MSIPMHKLLIIIRYINMRHIIFELFVYPKIRCLHEKLD